MKRRGTVGIMTMHRVQNFGSILQAYALYSVVKNAGYICEIIDYQYPNDFHFSKNVTRQTPSFFCSLYQRVKFVILERNRKTDLIHLLISTYPCQIISQVLMQYVNFPQSMIFILREAIRSGIRDVWKAILSFFSILLKRTITRYHMLPAFLLSKYLIIISSNIKNICRYTRK